MTQYSETELENYMRAALVEGRKALPECAPNPPVGCVLVRDGEIIARGYTNPPGQFHAEAMALAQVEGFLEDVTAFVTLEPCSFYGRTPSCAKTLVRRKIGEVFVALIDPHPKNRGCGIQIIKDADIPVQIGLLGEEAKKDLRPHLCKKEE
ncbi:MAG: bifunctional diaminohydroxyphosphoribosylaminopyrimidine deaminase/5-amino-6-(5-phosphoribosylamino)uracil reductase RibD [Candidatus Latescibacteria bacterium]|jgi:pyrimidine deaminase RibD-like protein|nr:bifunctional diaminohydroxyphosphoribosylaminopyrimidine deaminase/5-amino-6-(5-phosphoribosylamino)uracil reductase RibD [Candidatus Latescibacterota bacterium]